MVMKKIVLIFLLFVECAVAQLQRIEPPFWYAGMHNPELQVMFYGKNIAAHEVAVSNSVPINGVVRTENPNYLFVTIDTKGIDKGTDLVFTFSKNGKKAFTQKYELRRREPGSSLRKGFDSSDLIYLIMPDRFANGNPSNDNMPGMLDKADRSKPNSRHGGDIEGIIKSLDYIKGLGATAIWTTPLCEDNDERGSYHGYGQSDVYKIDSRFGTNEDYVRLSAEMHKRDMKLIKDYVTNHWGAHWMMNDLPTYDWIHQFPGYAQSNYRMTTQFDPNAADIDAKYCMDGWFVKSMPDLNQKNPLVLNYLIQNAIWWIEYANLDGFRVDTYSYCDKDGIAKWTKAIMDEYPYFNIVGEVWMHDQAQMAYWQRNSKIGAIQSYNSHLPSVMDFTLHDAIGIAFNETEASWDKGMIRIYENFVNDFLYPDIDNILVFAENHDTQRFNQAYPNIEDYKLAMTLIATVRGIPQIYYGSEIGMQGDKAKGDPDIRHDFPGGWPNDSQNAFTVSGRTRKQNQYFDFTKKLFNWRKNQPVIHKGKTTQYIPQENVYVYFRYTDEKTIMVVLNNSTKEQSLKTDRFKESIGPWQFGQDVLSGYQFDLSKDIKIAPKTPLILELK
jgi:glycosidase